MESPHPSGLGFTQRITSELFRSACELCGSPFLLMFILTLNMFLCVCVTFYEDNSTFENWGIQIFPYSGKKKKKGMNNSDLMHIHLKSVIKFNRC